MKKFRLLDKLIEFFKSVDEERKGALQKLLFAEGKERINKKLRQKER